MLWLCVELPALRLEVCTRGSRDPDAPAVLVESNRIRYANAAAARHGILLGSSYATAASLCHRLRHFARDPALERERLTFLAGALYRFSACVSLHDCAGSDRAPALLLEISGSLRLFGGLYALKRQLCAELAELGHLVELGIGHTPLAALALARAKVGVELPHWPQHEQARAVCTKALRRLPIAHTELDADLIERLDDMGITALGSLLELPARALGRRFGKRLLDYLGRLSGELPDPRLQFVPAPEFETTLHLLDSISDKQVLLFPMQRLLHDLEHWLIARQLGVSALCWTFVSVGRVPVALTIEVSEPHQRQDALSAFSRLKLDATELPDEIVTIGLCATRLSGWTSAHATAHVSLFARPGRGAETPSTLLDRFRARLGAEVCHGIAEHDDLRPEHAWKPIEPALDALERRQATASKTATAPKTTIAAKNGASSRRSAARPLWLLAEPVRIEARQWTLLHGPERIDRAWWDADTPLDAIGHRDYYVARRADGTTYWIYREAEHWYAHGCFA